MRKIFFTLTIVPFLLVSSLAQAEYERTTVGISSGIFAAVATGKETVDGTNQVTEQDGAFKDEATSIFVEVDLGRLSLGVDYLIEGVDSPENQNAKSGSTNKAKVTIEKVANIYATLDVIGGAYVKLGYVQGDLATLETVATSSQSGGTVGDQRLDGYTIGLGYKHDLDNGMQVRAELNASEFDSFSVTDSSGDIYAFSDMITARAVISLAKSF